jgi:hypothetical protein
VWREKKKSIARTMARRTADCDETSNGCVLSMESDEHDVRKRSDNGKIEEHSKQESRCGVIS